VLLKPCVACVVVLVVLEAPCSAGWEAEVAVGHHSPLTRIFPIRTVKPADKDDLMQSQVVTAAPC
jgi:hypothetical protein